MTRDHLVLQRQQHLEEAGHAGRPLEVADVRLHGADEARLLCRATFAEDRRDRLRFDDVHHRGADAVRLDVGDLPGLDAGLLERGAHHRHLRGAAQGGERHAAPVLVHGGATHHREDRVPVGDGVREELEEDDAAPVAAHVPVGRGVEALAAAVRGGEPRLREPHRALRREDEVDAAHQREGALAEAQALARVVERRERGRAP